jgi:hypothetical protein
MIGTKSIEHPCESTAHPKTVTNNQEGASSRTLTQLEHMDHDESDIGSKRFGRRCSCSAVVAITKAKAKTIESESEGFYGDS